MEHGWTQDGVKISSPESLEKINRTLEDEGAIIVEHWHYKGGRSPDRNIFEDFDGFTHYLQTKTRAGDLFYVWSFEAVCKEEKILAQGKYPNEEGFIPEGGAY